MREDVFKVSNYNYDLPARFIAQEPVSVRDKSRLLVVNRRKDSIEECIFSDIIGFFNPGDVLVLNNTRVLKARLTAKKNTGARVELLLLKKLKPRVWEVLVKPGRRAKEGELLFFDKDIKAKVISRTAQGGRVLEFLSCDDDICLDDLGKVPLPPYIKKDIDDGEKYQTVYAQKQGAVAAPTAGLHFTQELLKEIINKGVEVVYVTLHCGLATFRPVKTEDIRDHKIDSEWIELTAPAENIINKAKKENRRVIAAGTTAIRTLESTAGYDENGIAGVKAFRGQTFLYIVPGYKFKAVDAVISNFHTPCSTNLVLISSFCGDDLLKKAYAYAIEKEFRFFSFGDAMMVI